MLKTPSLIPHLLRWTQYLLQGARVKCCIANEKHGEEPFHMFFLVLIQERTKEDQGIKARPDGYPAGGTATRYYSPRLRRDSCGIAYKTHRNVPPPTHCRVRLLCLCLLLQLHSLSGKRTGVRSYPTNDEQLIRVASFVILNTAKDLYSSIVEMFMRSLSLLYRDPI